LVDGHGATSDPVIFAAGEVALHYNALFDRHDRQETWAHAEAHGGHVGRSLVEPGGAYAELGSYWSDQFDFTLNAVGAPIGEIHVARGDPEEGSFLVFQLTDAMVVGVSAINAARDLRIAKRLIGRPAPTNLSRLADPLTDLRTLGA
jgi:NADPH-dependent 2,4-dienoyl-CoA reductase/sulfur reductase-like enzyme